MPRLQQVRVIGIVIGSLILGFTFVSFFASHPEGTRHPSYHPQGPSFDPASANMKAGVMQEPLDLNDGILLGVASAPKLENATLKAELGNAAWKLFHTTMAKFPDEPTDEESMALKSYIHLFARLYPCGDCARHFQQILEEYPPQVATRSTAAGWACHVHNEVNRSLKKPIFDCSKIGDFYDCGCAEDDEKSGKGKSKGTGTSVAGSSHDKDTAPKKGSASGGL